MGYFYWCQKSSSPSSPLVPNKPAKREVGSRDGHKEMEEANKSGMREGSIKGRRWDKEAKGDECGGEDKEVKGDERGDEPGGQ